MIGLKYYQVLSEDKTKSRLNTVYLLLIKVLNGQVTGLPLRIAIKKAEP